MGRILTGLVALITMGTAAHATTLAAGSLYGGTAQNQATCYLFNAGATAVTVKAPKIIREPGISLTLTFNDCPVSPDRLAAGAICVFAVKPIINSATHACRAVVDPDGAEVRGELDIRGGVGSGTVLQVEQLR